VEGWDAVLSPLYFGKRRTIACRWIASAVFPAVRQTRELMFDCSRGQPASLRGPRNDP